DRCRPAPGRPFLCVSPQRHPPECRHLHYRSMWRLRRGHPTKPHRPAVRRSAEFGKRLGENRLATKFLRSGARIAAHWTHVSAVRRFLPSIQEQRSEKLATTGNSTASQPGRLQAVDTE